MSYRLFTAVLFVGLLRTVAPANGAPTIPFVDGRWQGDIETGPDAIGFDECWASTTFDEGTTFALTKRNDENWLLKLSNRSWQLPNLHQYTMMAQVDFYPLVRVTADTQNQVLLTIAAIDQISLLGLIENGHTLSLTSDAFNGRYDLEGSAKAIEWIRTCFADQLAHEHPG